MNLALHSHASLLQDPFCEDSALPVIISHSFFNTNNMIRENKDGLYFALSICKQRGRGIFSAVLPSRKDSFVSECADKFIFFQTL